MTIRVGVNGFGRIGRNFFRALDAQKAVGKNTDIEIVAVNDLTDNATLAHLLKFDSILGRLPEDVSLEGDDTIVVGDTKIKALEVKDGPAELPWGDLGVDVVVESTGIFTNAAKAKGHLDAGAKKVIISAPATDEDITIVHRRQRRQVRRQPEHHLQRVVHHELPRPAGQGPQRRVRHRQGPDDHDPRLHPGPEPAGRPAQRPASRPRRRAEHRADLDRCRQGHRPGDARAEGQARRLRAARADPHRFGHRPHRRAGASRPPPRRSTPRCKAAAEGPLKGILKYYDAPIVSSDIVTDPHSSIFDSGLTKVIDNQAKVVSWYDNEWGYSNRLVDLVALVGKSL